eukprot:1914215-Rhodomonas_salina.1
MMMPQSRHLEVHSHLRFLARWFHHSPERFQPRNLQKSGECSNETRPVLDCQCVRLTCPLASQNCNSEG